MCICRYIIHMDMHEVLMVANATEKNEQGQGYGGRVRPCERGCSRSALTVSKVRSRGCKWGKSHAGSWEEPPGWKYKGRGKSRISKNNRVMSIKTGGDCRGVFLGEGACIRGDRLGMCVCGRVWGGVGGSYNRHVGLCGR